ncbi:MAG TPA: hypothetical protein VMM13_15415, partial [Euzebya sp.]|nr:hypothetical protein [Euzebya sp.]
MAHPAFHTARTRQLVIAGLAGTVVLCAAPATALTTVTDEVADTCDAQDDALDPMCDMVEDTTGPVQDVVEPALAPVIEPVEEAVEPVAEALPTDVLPSETAPLPGGEDAPAVPPAGETPGADSPARPGGSGAPGPASNPEGQEEVEAAGKAP